MNQIQTKSSDDQQARAAAAVEELKNNLATAQKNLDRNLQEIKKKAMREMERKDDEAEAVSLKKIDNEISAS